MQDGKLTLARFKLSDRRNFDQDIKEDFYLKIPERYLDIAETERHPYAVSPASCNS